MWCNKKFGETEQSVPEIEWTWYDRELQRYKMLAEYDSDRNTIVLTVRGHRTYYNLAKTVIHEYIHYLQPVHGNWYERFDKKHGYAENPYEVEAYHLSEIYTVDCVQWVVTRMEPTLQQRKLL